VHLDGSAGLKQHISMSAGMMTHIGLCHCGAATGASDFPDPAVLVGLVDYIAIRGMHAYLVVSDKA